MYRFFGRFMRSIDHTWQLYFVGLVFGIGFGTATEVVLLAATAYAAIQGLPYFAVLALPFLFAGGMMLFDTLAGFCIAGLFILVWAAALIYWRLGNVEDRWSSGVGAGPPPAPEAMPES